MFSRVAVHHAWGCIHDGDYGFAVARQAATSVPAKLASRLAKLVSGVTKLLSGAKSGKSSEFSDLRTKVGAESDCAGNGNASGMPLPSGQKVANCRKFNEISGLRTKRHFFTHKAIQLLSGERQAKMAISSAIATFTGGWRVGSHRGGQESSPLASVARPLHYPSRP